LSAVINDKIVRYFNTMTETYSKLKSSDYTPYPALSEEVFNLNFKVEAISAIWFKCSEDWTLPERRLADSYWSIITAGHGAVHLGEDGKKHSVKAGDFILFPCYSLHSMHPAPGTRMEMINVHFHALLYGILDVTGIFGLDGIYGKNTATLQEQSEEAAREYCLKPPGWERSIAARIELVLLDLLRRKKSLPEIPQKIIKLEPVLKLIENRLNDPALGLPDMAAELEVSEVYIRTLFRNLLQTSPVKYVRRQRINRACSLLTGTMMPVKRIAKSCGFREVQFFHRVFKELTGTTPAAYRKNSGF